MAETVILESTEASEPEVVKTSRLKNFRVNHPRAAKVVGIIAVTAGTFGVLAWRKNRKDADAIEDSPLDDQFDSSPETT